MQLDGSVARIRNQEYVSEQAHTAASALSRKKTPFAYGEPEGPRMVDTHSYKLSPFGPAEQLHGGSRLISASSFWILHSTIARSRSTHPEILSIGRYHCELPNGGTQVKGAYRFAEAVSAGAVNLSSLILLELMSETRMRVFRLMRS